MKRLISIQLRTHIETAEETIDRIDRALKEADVQTVIDGLAEVRILLVRMSVRTATLAILEKAVTHWVAGSDGSQ